ncbi:MAG: hypothetical protein AAGM67_06955, partial [Bacteroidota bacterium]
MSAFHMKQHFAIKHQQDDTASASCINEFAEEGRIQKMAPLSDEIREDLDVSVEEGNQGTKRKRPNNKGREKRRRYSILQKAEILSMLKIQTAEEVSKTTGIPIDTIRRWPAKEDAIRTAASKSITRNILSLGRKSVARYPIMEQKLFKLFQRKRSKGLRVSGLFLRINASRIVKTVYGADSAESFLASQGWLMRFTKRYRISFRRTTSNKAPSAVPPETLRRFHTTLRAFCLVGTDDKDGEFGRFPPERRLNLDQTPLPFAMGLEATWSETGAKDVRLAHPPSGLEKRQATIQILFRPPPFQNSATQNCYQPKLTLVFRGAGLRISMEEQKAWHADVNVQFQNNAWVDTTATDEWISRVLRPFTERVFGGREFLLTCDNLSCQKSEHFVHKVSERGGHVFFFPPNSTHLLQPVNAGLAQ